VFTPVFNHRHSHFFQIREMGLYRAFPTRLVSAIPKRL
jgi:hypothetical protein